MHASHAGISSAERKKERKDIQYSAKAEGADQWERSGQGIQFVPQRQPITLPPGAKPSSTHGEAHTHGEAPTQSGGGSVPAAVV